MRKCKLAAVSRDENQYLCRFVSAGSRFPWAWGPFLAVGIRMGIFAVETLHAKGWFDISTKLNLRWVPPDSCIIDGIQISTGCTMGKHNIDVEPGVGATAIFTKDTTQLEIKLK